jgi:transposase
MFIMESMGKKKPRPRRSFTPEFKAEIVELCQRGDRTARQVSQDFDLTETAVREWVKQAELDTGTRSDGLTSDEKAEVAQLRRKNRRLREDVDILKRAAAFFASRRPGERVPRCWRVHRGRGCGRGRGDQQGLAVVGDEGRVARRPGALTPPVQSSPRSRAVMRAAVRFSAPTLA